MKTPPRQWFVDLAINRRRGALLAERLGVTSDYSLICNEATRNEARDVCGVPAKPGTILGIPVLVRNELPDGFIVIQLDGART